MQYGHFDDAAREYVITRPDTPKCWSNYLGSTTYGAIVTNNAGGYSFFRSALRGRLLRLHFNHVPMDQPGRYFYLRDGETGDYWSTSWQPVGKPLTQYKTTCRHGTAYTAIESEYAGIASKTTYFVPLEKWYECWMIELTNRSERPRRLSTFTYCEYANDWNAALDHHNLQYSQYTVDCRFRNRMISQSIHGNLPEDPTYSFIRPQSRYTFLGLVGADVSGFDTDQVSFLGPYRTYANPVVVEQGQCTGTEAHGDNACGVLQTDLTLQPGETRRFMVLFGIGAPETRGRDALAEMSSVQKADAALDQLKRHWHSKLERYAARTPDPALDSMVNVWNAYNSLITYAWSRAASLVYMGSDRDGLGYRDTVQDMLGAMSLIPEEARGRLELMITGQVSTGGAMPVVDPFQHKPGHQTPPAPEEYRSDDSLWLFNTIPAYVKETGDVVFFDKVLPYADREQDTVLGHLRRAIQFSLDRRGIHGLPCGLLADWNDCLVLGQRGESVFVAFQLRLALNTYTDICRMLGRGDEVDWAQSQLREVDAAIQKHTWDGQWFIRAFRQDGSVIGSHAEAEGAMFLNAQAWAVISGAANREQALSAMDCLHERLFTPYGIELCAPPFVKTDPQVVRAAIYNPGMKENASIFNHAQSWAVIAETMLGRGDRAYEYYRAYMPAAYNDRAEIRQMEPYVHSQTTHGRHSRRHGNARLPWLSGTASWSYVTATQNILGIKPDYPGLRIEPCIPAKWDSYNVNRNFRGATYSIGVENPNHVQSGVKSVTCDGKNLDPKQPLPLAAPGGNVDVRVVMG